MTFIPQLTADGSFTFFSPQFNEAFHSHYGAKQEAQFKFVKPCQLAAKAQIKSELHLLDICYGLGYNTAAALETIWSVNPHCQVELMGLELDASVPQQAIVHALLEGWSTPIPQLLGKLTIDHQVASKSLKAKLLIGDARVTIQPIHQSTWRADAIFLDPFSPPKCPQLWTVEFLNLVSKCLKSDGILATYSCSAAVRKALSLVGLQFASTVNVGRKSPGTIAISSGNYLPTLSPQEHEHLQTRAAIPYRDPQLQDTSKAISHRRLQEQKLSNLEPTKHWKKRWQQQNRKNQVN